MANITINEISQNYTYNVGNSSYATVAFPITACWGPGFEDDRSSNDVAGSINDERLESVVWSRFKSNQEGLESFVSTFRGPTTQYIQHQDYSYQMAMTLLTSGYDILVSRIATGAAAQIDMPFINIETAEPVEQKYESEPVVETPFVVTPDKTAGTVTIIQNVVEPLVPPVVEGEEGNETTYNYKLVTTTSVYTIQGWFTIKGKYLGSFGNQLRVSLRKLLRSSTSGEIIPYWNCIVYVESTAGIRTSVENINFVFDVDNATDTILHINEVDSRFLTFETSTAPDTDNLVLPGELIDTGSILEDSLSTADFNTIWAPVLTAFPELTYITYNTINQLITGRLHDGSDLPVSETSVAASLNKAIEYAQYRYAWSAYGANPTNNQLINIANNTEYLTHGLNALLSNQQNVSKVKADAIVFREWMFNTAYTILGTLEDKLAYNPNRIIVPGWDDQDFKFLFDDDTKTVDINDVSPLHARLMDVAYVSRCATAYLDIPRSITRNTIYNEALQDDAANDIKMGYAQRLSRRISVELITEGSYYASHSALFAPWGRFAYAGTSKQAIASPSFLALLIDRAMIKNQTSQYEWQLPTSRKHNLRIGKLDYNISKKYLDVWQSLEGVGINCITQIPDLGVTIWGNSTLFEVPPATYQALANLSTRKLVNAIEDLAYRCGIGITFNYNNDQAYNAFYAGMSPLLDTMRNVGAIKDYYIRMAADINGLDNVNANSVVGKIYLVVEGVINDISIDLIALPPSVDLDQFRA